MKKKRDIIIIDFKEKLSFSKIYKLFITITLYE